MSMAANPNQSTAVAVARLVAVLCMLAIGASLLMPLLLPGGGQAALAVGPAYALAVVLMSTALGLSTSAQYVAAHRLGVAAMILGAVSLAAWIAGAMADWPEPGGVLARWQAFAPPPFVATGLVALGAAIGWRRHGASGVDLVALLGTLATALFCLVFVGHLYQASELTTGERLAPPSFAGTVLLLALSLASLYLHPAGPMNAYVGSDPGAVAKRRLLPAAVLTPVASGYLLVFALDGDRLSPTLAVALTVFANVLVMLVLINAAGNKVARVVWDRQRRMEKREERVRRQGLRDGLTQLLNRRGWDAELDAGEKRCRRERVNACVLVIDLDGLKQINDTEGHKAGDAYIHRAAAALRQAARRGEPLARLGGDEFAYLVVDCDEEVAVEIVARFEEALRRGRISASVGYAMRDGESLAAAFEAADAAMYQQKRQRKRRRA